MSEPYKGQLRFIQRSGTITSDYVKKISVKLSISRSDAKELIKQRLFGEKKLQQYNGNQWCDVKTELDNIIIDIDKYL